MLNSKTRELVALQEEAQARLAETRRSFVEGMKIAKEAKADLDYVHRKVRCAPPACAKCVCGANCRWQGVEAKDGAQVSVHPARPEDKC